MAFVRVLDEFGNEISVPEDDQLITDGTYTLLKGRPAVDRHGYALPMVAADQVQPPADELRGKALDAALEEAGLPTNGKVADKQARLAEHQASSSEAVTTTTTSEE